jgi:hypothetical protein
LNCTIFDIIDRKSAPPAKLWVLSKKAFLITNEGDKRGFILKQYEYDPAYMMDNCFGCDDLLDAEYPISYFSEAK